MKKVIIKIEKDELIIRISAEAMKEILEEADVENMVTEESQMEFRFVH